MSSSDYECGYTAPSDGYTRLSRGAGRAVTCGRAAVPREPWPAPFVSTSFETIEVDPSMV